MQRLFINRIIEEKLGSNGEEDLETECTELIQVKEAIDRIDGEKRTAVVLKKDEDNFMLIGGGQKNKYAVFAKLNGKMYLMANKFPIPKEGMELTISGKAQVYPIKRCMGIEMVLEAAKHYADRGTLAQTFNWEK